MTRVTLAFTLHPVGHVAADRCRSVHHEDSKQHHSIQQYSPKQTQTHICFWFQKNRKHILWKPVDSPDALVKLDEIVPLGKGIRAIWGENTKLKPTLGRGGWGNIRCGWRKLMGFVGLTFLLLVDDVLTEQIVVTQNDWRTQFRKVLLKPDHLVSETRAAGHLIVQPGNRHTCIQKTQTRFCVQAWFK